VSDFDVLIIGGYGLTDKAGGGHETRDRIRLHCNGHPATIEFLQKFVAHGGDIDRAETDFRTGDIQKMLGRSLNAIYLWDFLTHHGCSTEVVNHFQLEQTRLRSLLAAKPKVVAISTTFMAELPDLVEVARTVKELSPESVVIAGGVKVFKSYKKYNLVNQGYFDGVDVTPLIRNNLFFDYEQDKWIDIFVIEECGELTLLELIRKIAAKQDWRGTANLAYYDHRQLVFTPRVPEPCTLEQHPISWETVPEEILGHEIPVRAGMGCPFKCRFCDFVGLHQVRLRRIDSLLDELERIQTRFPGRPIWFSDDNLFTNRRRTSQLCRGIIDRGLKFRWRAFFRADAIDEENAFLLAESGCVFPLLGVESGDDRILQSMDKRLSSEQVLRAVHSLDRAGVSTFSTIIVGFPGETPESVQNTASLLNSYPTSNSTMHTYISFVFMPLPLSPVYSPSERRRHSLSGLYNTWSHRTMDSAEANEQLVRLFQSVTSTCLQYPERAMGFPVPVVKNVMQIRDNLVRSGINTIDNDNAQSIYHTFKAALA